MGWQDSVRCFPFLAALRARDRFAGQSSDRTWLVGILRHKICDHLRRTCRERAVRADIPSTHGDDEAWEDAVMWLHDVAAESHHPAAVWNWPSSARTLNSRSANSRRAPPGLSTL